MKATINDKVTEILKQKIDNFIYGLIFLCMYNIIQRSGSLTRLYSSFYINKKRGTDNYGYSLKLIFFKRW